MPRKGFVPPGNLIAVTAKLIAVIAKLIAVAAKLIAMKIIGFETQRNPHETECRDIAEGRRGLSDRKVYKVYKVYKVRKVCKVYEVIRFCKAKRSEVPGEAIRDLLGL